jgi:glycosyltransferase involved in cell wall biosynthesis
MDASRLTVVIPAFNEAATLRGCLDSLVPQLEHLLEVVVVDNNSTDETASVIEEYAAEHGKFRSVPVAEQGVIYARTAGFDHARGDLIARIDADSRVNPHWAQSISDFFRHNGHVYEAGTGLCTSYDLPFQERFRRSHARITEAARAKSAESADGPGSDGTDLDRLFGSNMAITKVAWEKARSCSCMRPDVFEDLDLTLCLKQNGVRIGLIPGADATISGRRYLTPPPAYFRYCLRDQRTFKVHGLPRAQAKAVMQMVTVALPFYLINWIPFRAYDPLTQRFSVRTLIRPPDTRLTPRAHR